MGESRFLISGRGENESRPKHWCCEKGLLEHAGRQPVAVPLGWRLNQKVQRRQARTRCVGGGAHPEFVSDRDGLWRAAWRDILMSGDTVSGRGGRRPIPGGDSAGLHGPGRGGL